jgi:hypothetical protein
MMQDHEYHKFPDRSRWNIPWHSERPLMQICRISFAEILSETIQSERPSIPLRLDVWENKERLLNAER